MIRIVDFETDYLTSEIRRKKVVNPKWFRCPVNDSPEMQAVLCCEPTNRMFGFAVLGIWEQLQRWCMRHIKRQGCFVMKSGKPMTLEQITYAIGASGYEDFVLKAINVLKGIGWLDDLDGVPQSVLPSDEVGTIEVVPPMPKSLPTVTTYEETACDEGRFSSSQRYAHYGIVKEKVRELSKDEECPKAVENPRKLETALCDAIVEGRDLDEIIDAMKVYYWTEEGKGKDRVRPENFVRNKKDIECWDSWFEDAQEIRRFNNRYLRIVNEAEGGDKFSLHRYIEKHADTRPTEMIRLFNEWKSKSNEVAEESGEVAEES